jgi:dipeptidyl aminopeptidase/acylaminoacyl peptidase
MSPRLLLDSTPVELNRYQLSTIKRLYHDRLVERTHVERITYLSEGLRIKGYCARPAEPGVYPLIIWNRGGWMESGALDDLTAYLILASTAEWGYVVLATQYRGTKGGDGVEEWGGGDINDAYNLLELAKEIPEADLSRVAVEGASRGGMTTFRLLTMTEQFKCAIVHAPLTNIAALCEIREDFRKYVRKLFGNLSPEERDAEIRRRSAVNFADKLAPNTPILFLHGTDDKRIPISQSEELIAKLKALGHPFEFERIEGGGHVALKDGSYRQIDLLRRPWLERFLK